MRFIPTAAPPPGGDVGAGLGVVRGFGRRGFPVIVGCRFLFWRSTSRLSAMRDQRELRFSVSRECHHANDPRIKAATPEAQPDLSARRRSLVYRRKNGPTSWSAPVKWLPGLGSNQLRF